MLLVIYVDNGSMGNGKSFEMQDRYRNLPNMRKGDLMEELDEYLSKI